MFDLVCMCSAGFLKNDIFSLAFSFSVNIFRRGTSNKTRESTALCIFFC